jgi:general secretion pathway protein C
MSEIALVGRNKIVIAFHHNRRMLLNMQDGADTRWRVRGVTFVVWAAALASVVFWGLKATSSSGGPQAAVMPAAVTPVDTNQVARLLGARAVQVATVAAPNRFALVGVITGAPHGAALIAIDGQPPKPFRVGGALEQDLVLQSVTPRRAVLARSMDGPAVATLELPLPKSSGPSGMPVAVPMPGALPVPGPQSIPIPAEVTTGS